MTSQVEPAEFLDHGREGYWVRFQDGNTHPDEVVFRVPQINAAVKKLEEEWEKMQPGRYKTLTESDTDEAWMHGFHYAIELLKNADIPSAEPENTGN